MRVALATVCVDPRLNHELLRIQIGQRLSRLSITADRIFIVNAIGGNPGANVQEVLELLKQSGDSVAWAAVLHHDDCLAAKQNLRIDLSDAAGQLTSALRRLGLAIPVQTGNVLTENNVLTWSDDPSPPYQPFTFGFRP